MRNKIFAFSILICLLNCLNTAYALPAGGQKIMIAAASQYAVNYGKEISKKGGNVVDVACAVGLTMAVTNPYFASLGGGGFALFRVGKNTEALDFREVAPARTSPDYYENKPKDSSVLGGNAVGVPGMLMGYYELHKKFGKLKWTDILEGPIQLAQKGFEITNELNVRTEDFKGKFNPYGLALFFKQSQVSYKPGEVFKQPGLAKALQIAKSGPKGFYQGQVAQDLVEAVQKSGGILSLDDLKAYKVRWLKPMNTNFMDHTFYLMPPPSSGGVVLTTILKLIEMRNLKAQKPQSLDEAHLLAEIFHRAFRGRALLGDPDFNTNPIEQLLSAANILSLNNTINPQKRVQLQPAEKEIRPQPIESTETTHFSILDANGDAVAMTITLNGSFGSGVVSKKFGITLNNEMDDFTTKPKEPNVYGLIQGTANKVEPGKRPLSSMTPTLVEKDGKIILVVGAQGGPRIISSVAQVIYRNLLNNFNIEESINTPRIHAQFMPAIVYLDQKRWSPELLDGLRSRGHQVEESWMGRVYGVRLTTRGLLEGAADNRVEGTAGGY
ncbi:MAG: hypothetical protein A4S09_09505 [Proteobacteria bacterium SG_bin7]|nr:MAG: hypothetical protein A4S09_09505 [Proteobacteria bacterium SG_bin7]